MIICSIKGHKWECIANFHDIEGGRALWQCERCKKLIIDATYEFYAKRERKTPYV